MSIRTGENEQGLKKIIDMTRMIAIVVLLLHCYDNCYAAFKIWGWTAGLSDKILGNISRTGMLNGFIKSKYVRYTGDVLSRINVYCIGYYCLAGVPI